MKNTKETMIINANDKKIIELQNAINAKRESMNLEYEKFNPSTNCILHLGNVDYNLNVMPRESLVNLLVFFNSQLLSAVDLDMVDDLFFCGYHVYEWIKDIKNKIGCIDYRENKKSLDNMEKKLEEFMSNDLRASREIDKMSEMIKGM